jgi:hypothetical protein
MSITAPSLSKSSNHSNQYRKTIGHALSLRPGLEVMEAATVGNEYAQAIRDAWQFRFPVRAVTPEEFARMLDGGVCFHG